METGRTLKYARYKRIMLKVKLLYALLVFTTLVCNTPLSEWLKKKLSNSEEMNFSIFLLYCTVCFQKRFEKKDNEGKLKNK